MVLQRIPLSQSNGQKGVLVCNPTHLEELFKLAFVTKHVQRMVDAAVMSPYLLSLEARCILYKYQQLSANGRIYLRLPKTEEERSYMAKLPESEIWEISEEEYEKVATIEGDTLSIKGGSTEEKETLRALWKSFDVDLPLSKRLVAIIAEGFRGFSYKTRSVGVAYPFPLFRKPFLSVFSGTKKEALALILERLRQRYVAKRDLEKVPSGLVVTPNLDHLRFLFEEENSEFQKFYKHSFLQTADGYPPLVMYGKASLGFQPQEQVTGIDIFMQLINLIGKESLPYTIYLVGGFGNIPYKTRDYFVSIYPHLKDNFVGISTPAFGFLENKDIVDAIAKDIDQKKPDIIFAGMTVPTQEKFVYELMSRGVNFGIGFCVGRAIEMVVGYQKKEPALIDKLHLAWIYRMFFGPRKDIKKRQQGRVVKDFKFVFQTLFSK